MKEVLVTTTDGKVNLHTGVSTAVFVLDGKFLEVIYNNGKSSEMYSANILENVKVTVIEEEETDVNSEPESQGETPPADGS